MFLFQVRINAVIPLSVPPERRYYGDVTLYSHVYATLIDALKGTENVTEFCEFKYRDTLRQQVGFHALYVDLNAVPCVQLPRETGVGLRAVGGVIVSLLYMIAPKIRFLLIAVQFFVSHDATDDSRRCCFSGLCAGGKPRHLQRIHHRSCSTT